MSSPLQLLPCRKGRGSKVVCTSNAGGTQLREREDNIRRARVYLREAHLRLSNPAQRAFCFKLLGWAANCRRRAMAAPRPPVQGALFE